jgi:hypothetical protein
MDFSIVHPHIIPSDWRATASGKLTSFFVLEVSSMNIHPIDWTVPSEKQILERDLYVSGYNVTSEDLTGVDTLALAYAASHALSIYEIPTVSFENNGSFNRLLRIEFPQHGRKLLARIPLKDSGSVSRIEASVATMSFARWVRNIPAPKIHAWNASNDNPVGVPYVLQEYIENAVEPWQVWGKASDSTRSGILEELAHWHAAFLEPLPPLLSDIGDLGFAPGLSAAAPLLDPQSYIVDHLWDRLWSHHMRSASGLQTDREALGLDDEQSDAASFAITATRVRDFAKDVLSLLKQYPLYLLPCLANCDYAFRNILLDPCTYRVKAFIDWDDVHVMPFIISVDFPEDIKAFSVKGLSLNSNYYHEGGFSFLPPDEHGKIIGSVDDSGNLTDIDENGQPTGIFERDERICNTLLREQFVKALEMRDERVAQSDVWKVRSKVLKAHHLLTKGGRIWWQKRQWLGKQLSAS